MSDWSDTSDGISPCNLRLTTYELQLPTSCFLLPKSQILLAESQMHIIDHLLDALLLTLRAHQQNIA